MPPRRAQNVLLLLGSYFFYACWDWRFLGLLLLSSCTDWLLGNAIGRETTSRGARKWVAASVTLNLLFLGFFKYFNFFVDSATALLGSLGWKAGLFHLHIVLPVGISFYTFQSISYIVDVYRKEVEPACTTDTSTPTPQLPRLPSPHFPTFPYTVSGRHKPQNPLTIILRILLQPLIQTSS